MPENALMKLPPEADLDALRLDPFQRLVAETMVKYGVRVGDSESPLTRLPCERGLT